VIQETGSQVDPAELADALKTAHSLVGELNSRNTALAQELATLRAEHQAVIQSRDNAVAESTAARSERDALKAALPSMASKQASAILASLGHAPISGGDGRGSSATGGVKETFARMKPGSPEANAYFQKHRTELLS
jgi:uncharacterized small protein (DUF1192 family)